MEKNTLQELIYNFLRISLCLFIIFICSHSKGFTQSSAEEFFELGKKLYDEKKFTEAIESFEHASELNSFSAEYFYWIGASSISALENASLFKKASLSYNAKNSLIKALEIDSSHILARIRLINYYIQAPAIAGGSYSKAMEHVTVLKEYDLINATELEANIYLQKEEFDKAEKVYLSLLKNGNNNEKIYYRLSIVSLSRKNFLQAINFCQKSINEFPNYLMGYYQYGKVSSIGNININEAIINLNKYISSNVPANLPKKHWAYYRLGKIHELKGEIEKAKEAYNNALELNKSFSEARVALDNIR